MSKKIRWGVLSTANIGRKRVIPAIQASSNGEVFAVASRDADRARDFADSLDIPTAYGDYASLIADPDVDAIYNPLPNSQHAEWSIRCAQAGKPTLCEKPLARNAEEAQQMVDAFAEHGVLFAEAFMYRFHPQTQRVKTMLDDGAIGELHTIDATFTFSLRDESNIRLSRELAGGSVMDVGCYCINMMRLMTGEEPQHGEAVMEVGPSTGVDERLAGVLQFPAGVIGHFDSSLRSYRTHRYELRGSGGRIVVDEGFVMDSSKPTVIRHWHGTDFYGEVRIPPADHYQLMVEDFADALLNDRAPRFSPADAVANMRVIDLLLGELKYQ